MEQTRQLVVGGVVEVTEILIANRSLNGQSIGDVSFNINVERRVVLLRRRVVREATEAV